MGTNYPGSLDAYSRPSASTPMNASGYEGHTVVDNLYDAVEAIETELGTDPAGGAATVKARLNVVNSMAASQAAWPLSSTWRTHNSLASSDHGTALTMSADFAYWVPWPVAESVTLDRVAIKVDTAQASSHVRVGLYSANANGSPNALILDAGAIDSSTTGVKELTVSQSLTEGLIWVCCLNETTGVKLVACSNYAIVPQVWSGTNSGDSAGCNYITSARAYGSGLESTAPTFSSFGLSTIGQGPFRVWMRRT